MTTTKNKSPDTIKLWLVEFVAEPFYNVDIVAETRNRARYRGAIEMNVEYIGVYAYPAEYRICPDCGMKILYRKSTSDNVMCWECYEGMYYG